VRLRRARAIVTYWHEGRLVFQNYRTLVSIAADPVAIRILSFFDRWRRPDELLPHMREYAPGSVRSALQQLTQHTLLLQEGTPEALQDARLEKVWSGWLPHGAFHFGTKDAPFVSTAQTKRRLKRYLAESPQPAFFKSYRKAPQVRLPREDAPEGEFPRVLMARRTHRQFSQEDLPLSSASKLLFYTWGETGFVHSPVLGRLPHKTSPSGGARHPTEVYLAALRVKGLAPGLYHYDARRHRLEVLRKGAMDAKAVQYCAGQHYVKSAAALFLMTAVFPRSMWKYRLARAYRVVLLDAGHLCQTFCLTATWLGLAPFCTAALKDSLIEKDLGLDGISESVLYVAGVGVPRAGAAG
jgi:SagB-type dehydrogenase family enzyme